MNQFDLIKRMDWNYLIVLDACRYDVFKKLIFKYFDGELVKCNSSVNNTSSWYQKWKTIASSVTLVSASPIPWQNKTYSLFYKAVPVWYNDDWLDPKSAFCELKKADGKRFLIHLIPPHLPLQGSKGKVFMDNWLKQNNFNEKITPNGKVATGRGVTHTIYSLITKYGEKHGYKLLKKYYAENVEFGIASIRNHFPCKWDGVIITSDHSESIGEGCGYFHSIAAKGISEVPWFKVKV